MTKIKCLKCGDIIESDGKGKWVECSCHSCYIDETEYYCRVGGDFDKLEVEKDGQWILASEYLKENEDKNEQ